MSASVRGSHRPGSFIGAEVANEAGSLAWNELSIRDLCVARAFYRSVFGWEAHGVDMGEMRYTEWRLRDKAVAGMRAMPETVPPEVPAHRLVYFAVDDADAVVAEATALRRTTILVPTDIPPGRFAVLADPEGAAFAVITLQS